MYWVPVQEIAGIPKIANRNSNFLTLQKSEFQKKNPTGIFGIVNGIGIPPPMGVLEIGTKNRNSQPRRRTNLHPSMAWGNFIEANSFASASSISNSWSGLWNRIGSNRYTVPVYGKCGHVEPMGIVEESATRAADDTSINWSPSLTVNLEVQNFSWSERTSRLMHVSARIDKWIFFSVALTSDTEFQSNRQHPSTRVTAPIRYALPSLVPAQCPLPCPLLSHKQVIVSS